MDSNQEGRKRKSIPFHFFRVKPKACAEPGQPPSRPSEGSDPAQLDTRPVSAIKDTLLHPAELPAPAASRDADPEETPAHEHPP